jgi:shikimate kinase
MKPPQNNIYLTGFMGVGKTTVGKILAKKLSYRFIDTDVWVESRSGKTVAELFLLGEEVFRTAEKEVVASVTSLCGQVVALGGGVLLNAENRRAINHAGRLIYLAASVKELARRIESSAQLRPLLTGVAPGQMRITELFTAREPWYLAASVTINTDGIDAEQVAELIWRELSP